LKYRFRNTLLIISFQLTVPLFGMNDSSITIKYNHDFILLKNELNTVPLKKLGTHKIASIDLSNSRYLNFQHTSNLYTQIDHFRFNTFSSKRMIKAMAKEIKEYDLVLIVTDTLHALMYGLFDEIGTNTTTALSYLGHDHFPEYKDVEPFFEVITHSPNRSEREYGVTSQLLFGGYPFNNTLSKDIRTPHPKGFGLQTVKTRLSYGNTSELIINDQKLVEIDSIVNDAINNEAIPGCQILAAKDGHVFYQKSFGYHTYDSTSKKVSNADIYDLASITKIASSAMTLMKLESEGKFSVDSSLGIYLPEMLDTSDYKYLKIKDILTHQAGLASWIPFFFNTLEDGKPSYALYSKYPSSIHKNRVAKDLYILDSYRDSIFYAILNTKLKKKKKYKYSDLGYYFVNEIIGEITDQSQDEYVEQIYAQLGLRNIGYCPRKKWSTDRIPPTENDTLFRNQLVHADVHDQGAALLGGVGGHAGLFSNSNDLAVIMQLFLNKGTYGGDTIFKKEMIEKYTSAPFYETNDNRRGITFDKPVRNGAGGPTCFECMSLSSFGHSGFTGNLTWADPESGLIYVFLSNRVYPDAENHKLITMNIRTEVMQVITDALELKFPLEAQ